jgi:hypothetical protein
MNAHNFNNLLSSVQRHGFDDDKVDTIKTTIQAAQRISAPQVVKLLETLSFDDKKLEVAKMAYRYTTEPLSYSSIVGEAFSFSKIESRIK